MRIYFSREIFHWQISFDEPKDGFLSNQDMPVTLRIQQGGGSVMIWGGIVNQTIIGLYKVDEGVKLNSAN